MQVYMGTAHEVARHTLSIIGQGSTAGYATRKRGALCDCRLETGGYLLRNSNTGKLVRYPCFPEIGEDVKTSN